MIEQLDKDYFDKVAQTIVESNKDACIRLIEDGLNKKVDPMDILEKGLNKGIQQVNKVRELDPLIKVYNLKENLSDKNARSIKEQIIKNCKCKI